MSSVDHSSLPVAAQPLSLGAVPTSRTSALAAKEIPEELLEYLKPVSSSYALASTRGRNLEPAHSSQRQPTSFSQYDLSVHELNPEEIFDQIQDLIDIFRRPDKNIFFGPDFKFPDLVPSVTPLGDFQQGAVGNCFFLAAIKAMCMDEEGLEAFNRMVVPAADGSGAYDVSFIGRPGTVIRVTAEEIAQYRAAGMCSTGDDRVAAMEIAAHKIFGDKLFEGGFTETVLELLLGEEAFSSFFDKDEFVTMLTFLSGDGDGVTVTVAASVDQQTGNMVADNGQGLHAFVITGYDPNTQMITYVNPWDTSVVRTISLEEFLKIAKYVTSVEPGENSSFEQYMAANWFQYDYGSDYVYV